MKSTPKFTEEDAQLIVKKTLDYLKSVVGSDILLTASGTGIITLEEVKKKISEILYGEG